MPLPWTPVFARVGNEASADVCHNYDTKACVPPKLVQHHDFSTRTELAAPWPYLLDTDKYRTRSDMGDRGLGVVTFVYPGESMSTVSASARVLVLAWFGDQGRVCASPFSR